jgi:hypothetical protein
MLSIVVIKAQKVHKDYFVGKWEVVCVGTPGGDSKMIVSLVRKNGKLEGTVTPVGKEPKEIIEVEEMQNAVKVYFRHNLFKVNLLLDRKDDNHTSGFLMGKFQAKSVRLN